MEFCKNRENPVNETEKKMFVKQGNNVTKTENNYSDPAIRPKGLNNRILEKQGKPCK